MGQRLELQVLLESITDHVYFQPPPTLKIEKPCIVYHRDFAETYHADNFPYKITKRYQVTVIDPNPDSDIPTKVAKLPMCIFDRFFTSDNLNHDVYKLFF